MEFAAARVGELREEIVIGCLARHLGLILIDEETRRRLAAGLLPLRVLAATAHHQAVLTGHVRLPERAAFLILFAGGRYGAFALLRPEDLDLETGILDLDAALAAQPNREAELAT